MSFLKTSASALTKLLTVVALAAAFFAGLVGVIYLSLRGEEVKVPELVGKDFGSSEKEIEGMGLKLKRQATRYSEEKPNTVLEQLPKPGETVKTGQTILVVLSEANPEGNEAPATIKKETNTNNADEDEGTDIAPDKPVKSNKNANVKKPSQTTRDVISNKSNKNSNTPDSNSNNSNSSKSASNDNKNSGNKNSSTAPTGKPTPANSNKSDSTKSSETKTSGAGDTRTRKVPQ